MEKMIDFFSSRVDIYDEHMLANVEGCKEGYIKLSQLIPKQCKNILDLGCGTGLELYEVFKLFPNVSVTGIDLTPAMLEKLEQKYLDKSVNLICGDYFKVDLGKEQYDCAISFQTMHHFPKDKKSLLYKKIFNAIKKDGLYIECDYMVTNVEEENLYLKESELARKEMNNSEEEFYHYDIPCTIDNQILLLKNAGFLNVESKFRQGNTTIIVAYKKV